MSTQQTQAKPRKIKPKTVVLILLIVGITLFCAFNRQPTPVWPFGGQMPLIVVILLAFAMGLAIGWIAKGLLAGRHVLAPDTPVDVVERNQR